MPRFISAAEANRQFSEILGQAAEGETVVITRRGEPVAQLLPFGQARALDDARDGAMSRLVKTLEEGLHLGGRRPARDDLYDR